MLQALDRYECPSGSQKKEALPLRLYIYGHLKSYEYLCKTMRAKGQDGLTKQFIPIQRIPENADLIVRSFYKSSKNYYVLPGTSVTLSRREPESSIRMT